MAKYKREVTEYISDRIDIIDVVGGVVQLKKAGRNHKGLCPFHSEKTPSFVVSQEKQFFHCFGCGKSGSAISFVMEHENIGFLDALESLAERYGIDISPFLNDQASRHHYDNTAKLYQIMKQVARYYFRQLQDSPPALQYLDQRGITTNIARTFGLGFARDSWDDVLKLGQRAAYSQRELMDCGLLSKNEQSRYYDRFRNRLMFPIFDRRGRVVAFGGRVLDDSLPKYLNSPETAIFHKSNILYGLNFARRNLTKSKSVILVEGYIDVITLHQYGYQNAVASLGTALTEHHVKQLDRIFEEVIFAYDGDSAGRAAIMKSLAVFQGASLNVRIVDMAQYKDPDEALHSVRQPGFDRMINQAQDTVTFSLDYLQRDYQVDSPNGRLAFLKEAFRHIGQISLSSERQIYIEKLAERLALNGNSVARDFSKWYSENRTQFKRRDPARQSVELPADNQFSALQETSQLYRVEQALLAGLLRGAIDRDSFRRRVDGFYYPILDKLATALLNHLNQYGSFDMAQAIDQFSLEQLQLLEKIQQLKDDWQSEHTLDKMVLTQRRLLLLEKRKDIDKEIEKQRIMTDQNAQLELRKLLTKRDKIQAELAEINRLFNN